MVTLQVWQLLMGLHAQRGTRVVPEASTRFELEGLLYKWLEVGRVVMNWVDSNVADKLGELVEDR